MQYLFDSVCFKHFMKMVERKHYSDILHLKLLLTLIEQDDYDPSDKAQIDFIFNIYIVYFRNQSN